jgi:hypothetical protein
MPIAFASAGLPARFILISHASPNFAQRTANDNFAAAVLFLLWYVRQIEN